MTPRCLRALLPAAVSATALPVRAAHAEPPLRDVRPISTDVTSTGARVIAGRSRLACMPLARRPRVIDERFAEVAAVVEPGRARRSLGGGALLWRCDRAPGPSRWLLLHRRARRRAARRQSPNLPLGGHGDMPDWVAVGLRWLTVTYDGTPDAHVNRTPGRVVSPDQLPRRRSSLAGLQRSRPLTRRRPTPHIPDRTSAQQMQVSPAGRQPGKRVSSPPVRARPRAGRHATSNRRIATVLRT
jgi:hypothetical protein